MKFRGLVKSLVVGLFLAAQGWTVHCVIALKWGWKSRALLRLPSRLRFCPGGWGAARRPTGQGEGLVRQDGDGSAQPVISDEDGATVFSVMFGLSKEVFCVARLLSLHI